jgi:hypothetical protein
MPVAAVVSVVRRLSAGNVVALNDLLTALQVLLSQVEASIASADAGLAPACLRAALQVQSASDGYGGRDCRARSDIDSQPHQVCGVVAAGASGPDTRIGIQRNVDSGRRNRPRRS